MPTGVVAAIEVVGTAGARITATRYRGEPEAGVERAEAGGATQQGREGQWRCERQRQDAGAVLERTRGIERCVRAVELRGAEQVPEFESRHGMAVTVHVHVPPFAMGLQHRALGDVNERMPLRECLCRLGVAAARFRLQPVGVEFATR